MDFAWSLKKPGDNQSYSCACNMWAEDIKESGVLDNQNNLSGGNK